jgi:hypothetical protein
MKRFLSSITAVLVIFLLWSCEKETAQTDPAPAVYTVAGLWEGTYLTDQQVHQQAYASFTFYPDGSLIARTKGVPPSQTVVFAKGQWTRTNNKLTFRDTTINYSSTVIQSGEFTFDSSKNTLTSGTWRNVTGDNGVFFTGTYPAMQEVK